MPKFGNILAIFAIIFISLPTFYPSFNLALFGDDWVSLWKYERMVGKFSLGLWNHLTYIHNLYGSMDITMGSISKVFGYQSSAYYIISYLLRLLASFSFYPVTFYLTKNKLASFFAMLFFSITTIGLGTTNWVFNMPSYLMIAFFNLFLYFFLISRENLKFKYFISSLIFFYAAIISSPPRTTGFLPFIIIIELFWLFKNRTFPVLKKVLLRLSIITLIFLFLLIGTNTYSAPDWDRQAIPPATYEITSTILNSINKSLELIENGQYDFLFYPLSAIGGMFIPNFEGGFETSFALIGGFVIVAWLALLIKLKNSYLADLFFISFVWTLLSLLIPWIRDLSSVFPTTHRYLISSAVGITLLLAALISLGRNTKSKTIVLLLVLAITVIHLYSTSSYFNRLFAVRNQKLADTIWSQMPKLTKENFSKGPLAFYFSGENGDIIHNILTFGFPSRMQLIYGIADYRSVVTLSSFEETLSAVTDGKSLTKHQLPEKPIPITNIYTFHLEGSNKLIDTTTATRDKLSQLLKR